MFAQNTHRLNATLTSPKFPDLMIDTIIHNFVRAVYTLSNKKSRHSSLCMCRGYICRNEYGTLPNLISDYIISFVVVAMVAPGEVAPWAVAPGEALDPGEVTVWVSILLICIVILLLCADPEGGGGRGPDTPPT